jgi:DNA invertase Pin-like site-specific DNA recombinase
MQNNDLPVIPAVASSKSKRAVAYIRVSTSSKSRHGEAVEYDQNPEVQLQPLNELVVHRGWNLAKVYSRRASGASERRPGLDALMADARRGPFEVVVVFRATLIRREDRWRARRIERRRTKAKRQRYCSNDLKPTQGVKE